MSKNRQKLIYLVLQSISCCLWVVFSIIDAGAFNGFVRSSKLCKLTDNAAAVFCLILGLIESLLYLSACGLGLYCIWAVHTVNNDIIFKV
jgi:hypothetical protein